MFFLFLSYLPKKKKMENHNITQNTSLSPVEENVGKTQKPNHQESSLSDHRQSNFSGGGFEDMSPITSAGDFLREFVGESKKLWCLAGPSIFKSICNYSLGATTQVLAGHVSTVALAAVSVENSVIAGFSLGVMLGMGSALETLCGQAYGAGKVEMMGVYLQRSCLILTSSAFFLSFFYIFATPVLRLIGQPPAISAAAGKMALWMLPQLFAYALHFPTTRFLQAQRKVMAMAVIAGVALVLHAIFSWLLMLKLRWGLAGGAAVLDASWWFIVIAQNIYICTGACGRAWSGFSSKTFSNLCGFLRLSLASAVMLCLEIWYFMALILFAGYMKHAEISIAALSICMNILGWTIMVALGTNAAISVRVSNELGARNPRRAKFAVIVAVISATMASAVISLVLIIFRDKYPTLFADDAEVRSVVKRLTPLLALCITINTVQPVLSGVAVGAGWQAVIAYINIGCYYVFGIPLGLILGFKLKFGVMGIWYGMLTGTVVQTCVLFGMIYKTNWNKEAWMAEARIRRWGGETDQEMTLQEDENSSEAMKDG